MSKFRFTLNMMAIAAFLLTVTSMANAQATRTWVSGVGDDANPCSRTAPCKTFAGAISKTARNGEINALDGGGFGAVTITKSITIDGGGSWMAGILAAGTNAVIINITDAADVRRTVRLRNISMQGADSGFNGVRILSPLADSEVHIERCVIDGFQASTGRGIDDQRSAAGSELYVVDTSIRNNLGSGIAIVGGGVKASVMNSNLSNNTGAGIAIGGGSKASIMNSQVSGNTLAGLFADTANTELNADQCLVANNGVGINSGGGTSVVRVSNSTFINNTTLTTTSGGGTILSYGNNQSNGVALGGPVIQQ